MGEMDDKGCDGDYQNTSKHTISWHLLHLPGATSHPDTFQPSHDLLKTSTNLNVTGRGLKSEILGISCNTLLLVCMRKRTVGSTLGIELFDSI